MNNSTGELDESPPQTWAGAAGDQSLRHGRGPAVDHQFRLERTLLVVEAMWHLLCEHTDCAESDLVEKMDELDGQDGTRDGRRMPQVLLCPCGARIHPRSPICQYCGEAAPKRSVFDTI